MSKNAPDSEFVVLRLQPPAPMENTKQGWVNNHVKLRAYSEVAINGPTAFIDADTLVLRDPSELFDGSFDIGLARRPDNQKSIYNGGVVLMSPTHDAREFLANWATVDYTMLHDPEFHMEWHAKYRGMNQSSLGYMVERSPGAARVRDFPTAVINACEQDWPHVRRLNPYIVHVRKSALGIAQSTRVPSAGMEYVVNLWREYERQ